MAIKGFQVEMRVVVFDEAGARPQGFCGVGGYNFVSEDLIEPERFDFLQKRVHMIADELINKASARVNAEGVVEPLDGDEYTALQIHEMADIVAEGKFDCKVFKTTNEDGSISLTFTLIDPEPLN
tara:strand:+ start:1346 stop:1720 length:375 start_codon:yes stop_codon:yes gene_type:complete